MARLASTDVLEDIDTIPELVEMQQMEIEHASYATLRHLFHDRIKPFLLSHKSNAELKNKVSQFINAGGVDYVCRVIESMPSKHDGDEYYAPLSCAAYALLSYVVNVGEAMPALVAFLRNDVSLFRRLFSCTCYIDKTEADCNMDLMVQILQILIDYRPEYITACYTIGFIDMANLHLPTIIRSMTSAKTEIGRTKHSEHFKQCMHIMQVMGHFGLRRWYEIRMSKDVITIPALKFTQEMHIREVEGHCVDEIVPLIPRFHKLVKKHKDLQDCVYELSKFIDKTVIRRRTHRVRNVDTVRQTDLI